MSHSEVELQTEFNSFTAAHLGSNTNQHNQHTDWTVRGTCIKFSRSVYAPHLVQSLRLHLFKYRGGDNAHWISENKMGIQWELCGTNFSENIANLWVSCYNGNNDRSARVLFVQQPREQSEWLRQTLGFWLHNSPCSLGCWTNNTLAEPSLSPKYGIIGSYDGLAPNRRQTIIWNNDGLVYWRICASIDLNELKEMILSDYLSIRVATDAILSWGIL